MKTCKQLLNMPVYSIQDGSYLGKSSRIVINISKKLVEFIGVVHETEGLRFVPIKKVLGYGDYAMTIRSEDLLQDALEIGDKGYCIITDDFLANGKVIMESGDLVGEISDLELTDPPLKLLGVYVNGESKPSIRASDLRIMGKDIFILKLPEQPKQVTKIPIVEKPSDTLNEELNELIGQQVKLLLNKRLTKDIYSTNGNILFQEGTILGFEQILLAQKISPNVIIECALNVEV